MNAFIAKCGCNCIACPTYKKNIQTIEQKNECSSGWVKYLGIRLSPEKLRACDGCSLPDNERKTYYLNCKVLKCCQENGIDNCAYCSIYPCKELESVHSIQIVRSKEDFMSLTRKEITESDFQKFIEPYAGLKHLDEIRNHLSKSEIIHYKKFDVKTKSSRFPDNLSADNDAGHGLKRIYELITTLAIRSNVPYAEYITLKGKREELLKMLLAFGLHGRKVKDEKESLELDAEVYTSQKMPGMHNKLLDCLDEFKKHRISGEIMVLDSKNWQTPTGGLRGRGWKIRIYFGGSAGDAKDLKIFKEYIVKLNEKFGKNTYKYFNMADISVMVA